MARRDISGLYFNTDIGPVPMPPGPELTSSKILRRSARTRSRVTGGIRAIMFSSGICPEDASRRVVYQRHDIILPAKTTDDKCREPLLPAAAPRAYVPSAVPAPR